MNLKDKLSTLPKRPGCYLMKNKNGTIIYVGKAINLKNRVNSYFKGAHDYKTTKLVSNIVDFDYIVTKSEKEALILEYNLIKEYDPEFNIVFKDDKSYPYILVAEDKIPYVSVVRLKKNSKYKGKLFGPYPDVLAARNTVDLINKLFKTRKCQNLKKDLCLYYHINLCLGYCRYDVDDKECERIKDSITSFLSGDVKDVVNNLKKEMNDYRDTLNFEKAIECRDMINDIEHIILRQDVDLKNKESFDIFSYDYKDGYIAIVGLFIRDGRLLNSHHFIDYLIGDPQNFVTSYIYQFYNINPHPKKLYVDNDILPFLNEAFDSNVLTATRGHKRELLKKAKLNAMTFLEQNRSIIEKSENFNLDVKDEFKRIFNKDIRRIELFDNSHTAGKNTVAAMVVYEDFKPLKKAYRLYKLENGADDLKSMEEVLYRRYFRLIKDNLDKPDLIIVDGAKNQINVAKRVLSSLQLDITLVGLGKDEHHNTSYLMNDDCDIIEVRKDSNLFFFLTNMQDEVHRFAISYHRKLRSKSSIKSILDDVKGLGDKRKLILRRKYNSIAAMRQASLEELKEILPSDVANNLYNKLHEEEG